MRVEFQYEHPESGRDWDWTMELPDIPEPGDYVHLPMEPGLDMEGVTIFVVTERGFVLGERDRERVIVTLTRPEGRRLPPPNEAADS